MNLLYPRTCPVCGNPIPFNRTYCSCSDEDAQKIPPDVGDLSNTDDPLDPFTAVWYYNGRVRFDLLRLKFQRNASLAKPFGLALAKRVNDVFSGVSFDCVTFVPMTNDDLRERSLNQSALIAQWVARANFIQCSALLQKVRSTPNQHQLNQSDRIANLKDAFAPTDLVQPGSTVLLVDDIKTTGTTLRRCRDTLLEAGVKQVYCAAYAMSDFYSLDF